MVQTTKARSLYALLSPGMQYYDDALCSAALPQNKNGNNPFTDEDNILDGGTPNTLTKFTESFATIYPNPNRQGGNLTVEYNLSGHSFGQLKIFDIVGKLVQQIDLNPAANKVSFPLLEGITNGVYKVVLCNKDLVIKTFKLNVVQ